MAITSILGGQGRISDATLTAMLNSGDKDLINRANEYIEGAKKEAEERGTDKGILGIISDLFGFSKLAAAEPDMFNNQSNNQFSVTGTNVSSLQPEPIIPGTNVMKDSVLEDFVDTPTREFGDMRVGRKDQAIFGDSVGQRYNTENPELFFNTVAGQAEAEDEQNFFDYLTNLSGGVVDFAKDIAGRTIASQALGKGGAMVFGLPGALAGLTFGALKGGNMFEPSQSQLAFNALTPQQQTAVGSIYGRGGIMQGYNPISAFGKGPAGAIQDRINSIIERKYAGKDYSKSNLAKLQTALTNVGGEDTTGGGDYSQAPGRDSAVAQEASNRDAARGR